MHMNPSSDPGGGDAPASWVPTDDVANVSVLLMPGNYSVTGTPNVDAVGTWSDSSGNGNNAVIDMTGQQVPTDDGNGNPVFDETNLDALIIPASISALAAVDNGGFVVISKQTSPLEATVANYQNRTMISGSGASPHLIADDAGLRCGGYDGDNYVETNKAGFTADTVTVCAGKWDNTGLYVSLDGENWNPVEAYNVGRTSLDPANVGTNVYVGNGFGYGHGWDGTIYAVAIYTDVADLDNDKLSKWKTWSDAQGFGA